MLKAIILSFATTFFLHNDSNHNKVINHQQDDILLGVHQRADLEKEPYKTWFDKNYKEYKIKENYANKVKPLLVNVKIKIFMGTWCHDSQREVPHLFKILDAEGYNSKNVELVMVSYAKKTPNHLEEGFNIKRVPTIIFYKDGKEVNRIVEYPTRSLEKDMFLILSGKPYKDAYADFNLDKS
ncbi:TlpA family protein disulfide reductase [Zhouia sp. PK063]|uniref:TlpA family protein disulfide reductase n=1 Tax=Zhouia sp. PK063 TaxID=3373602 RepID=UPI0037951A02